MNTRGYPRWATLCLALGVVLMVVSAGVVVVPRVLADWATADIPRENLIPPEVRGNNIDGPINLLLLGLDERKGSNRAAGADSIIIVHIPADHRHVYMISIPRDTEVTVPPFPENGYPGGLEKVNSAFAIGSARDGRRDDSAAGRARGAGLTVRTLDALVPGGLTVNAVVIINFEGFRKVLNALGGVDICVDEETRSVHFDRNDRYHTKEVPYADRKVYRAKCQHLEGWEALDFARQRHFNVGAEYVRQRHQQQVLLAIFKELTSRGTLTDLGKLTALQKVAGDLLTVDLGDTPVIDWVWTLKSVTPKDVVMIKTNGGRLNPVGQGREGLTADSRRLLKAVHDDTVADFLSRHPDWIIRPR